MTSLTNNNADNSKIQKFTDGSKSEQGVGAGIAIYMSGTLIKNLKYRLDSKCTNNQAEQLAILRSLEHVEKLQTAEKEATVYTDSQTTLDSLKNNKIHTSLIEKITQKTIQLEQAAWKIKFGWVKAHAGTQGNEMADTLAKETAADMDITVSYNLIAKSVVKRELERNSVDKWQRDWNHTTKGSITEAYLPNVTERLNMKLSINRSLTTMMTGYGNIKAYLHRFKLIDSATCTCGDNDQTTDHLLYECELLMTHRDT